MKNIKALHIIVLALVIIVGTYGFVNADTITNKGRELGQQQANIEKSLIDNNEIVATVNGYEVTKKTFESYKCIINQNHNYSDKELLDKIIKEKVVYVEAKNEGYTVSDAEINTEIELVKKLLKEDENKDQYNYIKEYIEGLGITEDQYWSDIITPLYRETFVANKLIDSLRSEYIKEKNITDFAEMETEFSDYLNNYKEDLISNANIQTSIK